MTPPQTTALVIACVLGYAFFVGVTWACLPEQWREGAGGPLGVLGVSLWPVLLPVMLGVRLVRRLTRPTLPKATAREVK